MNTGKPHDADVRSWLPLTYLHTNRVGRTRFGRNTSGLDGGSRRVSRPVRLSMAWKRSGVNPQSSTDHLG